MFYASLCRFGRTHGPRSLLWFLSGLLLTSVIASIPWQPAIAAINQATVVEILDGNQVYIQNRQARKKDVAQRQQQVRTGSSRTELKFDNGAIGRLGKNSQLIVGSQCFQVQRGQILVNGAANGCTKSRRLSVRGTTYTVEVDDNEQSQITVLEGEVAVAPLEATAIENVPQTTPAVNEPEVVLKAGQRLSITPEGVVSKVIQLSQADFERMLMGELFSGFSTEIPGIGKVKSAFQKLYPGAAFPNLPRIPTPPIPIRLPF